MPFEDHREALRNLKRLPDHIAITLSFGTHTLYSPQRPIRFQKRTERALKRRYGLRFNRLESSTDMTAGPTDLTAGMRLIGGDADRRHPAPTEMQRACCATRESA